MTDSYTAALVDAFTDEPLTGNAAGVVPDAGGLTDTQMQAVARELAVSETAFLSDHPSADRQVRYFTPTTEVDLCGHATVAAHAYLRDHDRIAAGTHTLATQAGTLDIEVTDDTVWMTQNTPTVYERPVEYDRLADALGAEPSAFAGVGDALPVAYASTGLPFLIVPVSFLDGVGGLTPDDDAVAALADDHDAVGVYAFTFDTLTADATLHGRCFVPGAGVPEDPVTGTASGACGAYLDHFGAFRGDGTDAPAPGGTDVSAETGTPAEMLFEQGHYLDRPGRVRVQVDADSEGAPAVGGSAVTAFEGTVEIPPADDDEILEAG
ncbi:PhzF family phenazine biosynthesis protein [Halobaculum sp. MBLA0143]|uniref:PhzF family phenazine biosynthesis protein n=1 Tax=Halobaculum sp. MBLA0143 TaxID=3079933 RepID=UPI003523E554